MTEVVLFFLLVKGCYVSNSSMCLRALSPLTDAEEAPWGAMAVSAICQPTASQINRTYSRRTGSLGMCEAVPGKCSSIMQHGRRDLG